MAALNETSEHFWRVLDTRMTSRNVWGFEVEDYSTPRPVRYADPITPWYLWPMAIVAGLVIAWAIDQVMRLKEI